MISESRDTILGKVFVGRIWGILPAQALWAFAFAVLLGFMLNGVMAAFASSLLALEMVTWWPTQGPGYLLTTVAAVFIGGTSIYGGEGTIFGTIFGAFICGEHHGGDHGVGSRRFLVPARCRRRHAPRDSHEHDHRQTKTMRKQRR